MPLIREDDLVRIDLPTEGEWVEVKRVLSVGDKHAIQLASMQHAVVTLSGAITSFSGVDMLEANWVQLERAVKKWSFSERITRKNLEALDEESMTVIRARMNDLYPAPRSEEDTKNSEAG